MPWAKRITKPIPRMTSPTQTIEVNDYSLGLNDFLGNDKFPVKNGGTNMWRLAQDARIVTLGEYETRKGLDVHSTVSGQALDRSQQFTSGAANQSFSETTWLAQKFTPTQAGQLAALNINIRNDSSASGTILVELWSNGTNAPAALIARSSIGASALTSTYAYKTAYFVSAPSLSSGTTYWIVARVQSSGSGSYKWSSTAGGGGASMSSNSGMSWTAQTYDLNFTQLYAPAGTVKGFIRVTKSDGTKVTIVASRTSVYTIDDVSGSATNVIKSGLSASAVNYRFAFVNDILYYCNGYDGLRKWNFTTESQVNATNYTNLIVHKGILFGVRADDPTRVDFSNFANYETFTSTDFINVPAPKTGDPIQALHSLNGYLLIRTRRRCHILSGEDNATFRLDDAPDQKGTYSQETSVADKNYTYYLSDDGVYKSNGTQPILISDNVYETIRALLTKETACMAINKGRLYLWFASTGSSFNNRCYVWNLNLGDTDIIESLDTDAYVARAQSAYDDDDDMLVASSIVGQIFWQERSNNDYTNAGGDINFELRTHYFTFTSPAVLKEVRYWEPRFKAQSGSYTIDCEYAYDLRDNWSTYQSPNTQGSGPIWGNFVWGQATWGTSAEMQQQLYVPGEYRRIAIRYKHYATRQPQKFLGHTLVVQSRRMR